jgi:dTDP-D-glucose 4,6-dehydratase
VSTIRKCGSPTSAARKVLGWEPRVDFEEGITRTIEYFRGCLELGERIEPH